MRIAFIGNIGAGKTTIARIIATELNLEFIEEVVKNNPFLVSFYNDMKRWAFQTEQFFLWDFIKRIKDKDNYILDRSPIETPHIFVRYMFENGILSPDEYNIHMEMLDYVSKDIPDFDFIFYLNTGPTECMKRIQERAKVSNEEYDKRVVEAGGISMEYLKGLNELYVQELYKSNGKIISISGELPIDVIVRIVLDIVNSRKKVTRV